VTVGFVRVLLVKVSVPANVDNVPVVGSVMPVVPVTVNVVPKAPEIVSVLAALFATPVPPLAAGKVCGEVADSAQTNSERKCDKYISLVYI
jgi:hypothetical protein